MATDRIRFSGSLLAEGRNPHRRLSDGDCLSWDLTYESSSGLNSPAHPGSISFSRLNVRNSVSSLHRSSSVMLNNIHFSTKHHGDLPRQRRLLPSRCQSAGSISAAVPAGSYPERLMAPPVRSVPPNSASGGWRSRRQTSGSGSLGLYRAGEPGTSWPIDLCCRGRLTAFLF